ncbi:endothelin-converting enzyme 1 [Orussus abietinus]|uniref:endothelin-converting enzyme 1 n=1 Tax=Orussus abietinus TaxID=222816 RepID=UPI000C716262|nr:endothelin-converting enzyme 1 [Orussus abietinus]XP_012281298.2 endothelin-converting enzyme 1 [Orussus abietinus]
MYLGDALAVNAFNQRKLNLISILAGIIDWPYYLPEMPDSMQYGALGATIGHELSHAFDTDGVHMDYLGERAQIWSPEAYRTFESKAHCFIDQFNAYQYTELEVLGRVEFANGATTCDENMADSAGVIASFEAFKRSSRKREKGFKTLHGLQNFTSEQLFFLAFANVRCAFTSPYYLSYLIQFRQSHSFPRLRVIGSLSNMKEFSEAFKCPKGSPMNPDTKCVLWN